MISAMISAIPEFEFPVTLDDENFDKRLGFCCDLNEYQSNPMAKAELKGIYDWIFNSYRRLINDTYA